MRKLYTLGMLTILLSFVASPVFAGNEEECEKLKDSATKGLYIAYHNAGNSNAMQKILGNYNKKAGPGDPPMPGLDVIPCPCWSAENLADAADPDKLGLDPSSCGIIDDGMGFEFAKYGGGILQFLVDDSFCFQVNPDPEKYVFLSTDAENNQLHRLFS